MNRKLLMSSLFGVSMFGVVILVQAKATPPPSLTARDSGTYAMRPWLGAEETYSTGSYLTRTKDITFTVRSVNIRSDEALAALDLSWLIKEIQDGYTYNPAKTMVVRIDFWGNNGRERFEGTIGSASGYIARVDGAMRQLEPVLDTLQGISFSEENVRGGGRTQVLQSLYDYFKAKYPTVNFYQWWSPNTAYPDWSEGIYLSADGWIVDPYTLTPEIYPDAQYNMGSDPYKRFIQKYLITGKPLIGTIWASPHPYLFDPADPRNTYHLNMWDIMDHQFQTNIDYNVPSEFYWTDGNGSAYFPATTTDPFLQQMNERVYSYIERNKALPVGYDGNASIADLWSNMKPVSLVLNSATGEKTFSENFYQSKFLDVTSGTGFRDLVWNPYSLTARGFHGRPANATILYRFTSSTQTNWQTVTANLQLDGSKHGFARISISKDGVLWPVQATTPAVNGAYKLHVSTKNKSGFRKLKEFWVRIELQSDAGMTENPPVRLIDLSVAAK